MAGASMKDIKLRIRSVESTMQITKAMQLVATSKLRRAKERMESSKPFGVIAQKAIAAAVARCEDAHIPYLTPREGKRRCYVIIAGERGLAGGYNANIFRALREYPDAHVIPIGKRACDRFPGELLLAEPFSHKDAVRIARELCRDFAEGKYDRVGILCTRYISMMSQEAIFKWILPLAPTEAKTNSVIFEPDEATIFEAAVPEFVAGILTGAVRESFASEVAARRCAMDSAGKNAKEMIDELQLEYNRARQGAITQEITEIVAGSGI